MSGQSRSTSHRSRIPPGRHTPRIAARVRLAAIAFGMLVLSSCTTEHEVSAPSNPFEHVIGMELPQCETYVNPDPPYETEISCCPTGQGINQIGICVCLNGSPYAGCGEGGGGAPPGNPPTPGEPGGGSGDPPDPDPDPPDPEDPENPSLEVECSPEVVERGQPVSCSVLLSSGSMENLSWSFSGGTHTLSDLGSDNPLVGTMAVSGTATATATVDSTSLSGSASITVTPRNWSSKTYPVTIDNVGNGAPGDLQPLPPVPMDFEDFGDFRGRSDQAGDATAVIQPIPSGPNEGLAFLTDLPPAVYWGEIRLNEVAFTTGSDFLNAQNDCTVSELQDYFNTEVKAHEGLNFEPMSHAAWFREKLDQIVGNIHEEVVGEDGTGILQAISGAREEARSDAHAHAASLHGAPGGLAPLPNCNVVFPLH
jgi:hypothetical protein